MIRRLCALVALALVSAGCTSVGDPGWQTLGSSGCRQMYGARGSTSQSRPDLAFFCAESP